MLLQMLMMLQMLMITWRNLSPEENLGQPLQLGSHLAKVLGLALHPGRVRLDLSHADLGSGPQIADLSPIP